MAGDDRGSHAAIDDLEIHADAHRDEHRLIHGRIAERSTTAVQNAIDRNAGFARSEIEQRAHPTRARLPLPREAREIDALAAEEKRDRHNDNPPSTTRLCPT